jgi:hypothetical protein
MKKHSVAVTALLICVCTASAEGQQSSIGQFREQANYHLVMCRLKEKIAISKAQAGDSDANPVAEVGSCIRDAKSQVKAMFTPALKQVAKNQPASKLLKYYYGAWLTSINGVMPSPGERKINYEERQTQADERQEAIWNRLEVELGL